MKSVVFFFSLLALSNVALASDLPNSLSAQTSFVSYNSSGYLHQDTQRTDYGFAGDYVLPLSRYFRLKAIAILGLSSDFVFLGGGVTYDFVPASLAESSDGDSIEYIRFSKWRPFVDIAMGNATVQTTVDINRTSQVIREDFIGTLVRAGAGYAIDQKWELTGGVYYLNGSSNSISASGYGFTFGLRLNIF